MKINILDAGISYRAGHHYDYGLKLFRELVAAGHDVHVYGASVMDEEVAASFGAIGAALKAFQHSPIAVSNHQWQKAAE